MQMAYNKYRNKKVALNGNTYDSRKEARRHSELLLLEKAGAIRNLQTQVKYEIIPELREAPTETYKRGAKKGAFKPGKLIERATYYIADFVYSEGENLVVEDTKGFRTKDYILKRKLMLHVHGIKIKEI